MLLNITEMVDDHKALNVFYYFSIIYNNPS